MDTETKCKATLKNGNKCKYNVKHNGYCGIHKKTQNVRLQEVELLINYIREEDYKKLVIYFCNIYDIQNTQTINEFITKMIIYKLVKKLINQHKYIELSHLACIYTTCSNFDNMMNQGTISDKDFVEILEKMIDDIDINGIRSLYNIYPTFCNNFETMIYQKITEEINNTIKIKSSEGLPDYSDLSGQKHQYL